MTAHLRFITIINHALILISHILRALIAVVTTTKIASSGRVVQVKVSDTVKFLAVNKELLLVIRPRALHLIALIIVADTANAKIVTALRQAL